MKRKITIIILIDSWMSALIGIYFYVDEYIDNKKKELRYDLRSKIEALFEGQSDGQIISSNDVGIFFTSFSHMPVKHWKRVKMPSLDLANLKEFPKELKMSEEEIEKMNQTEKEEWESNYGDLSGLYSLNWGDEYPNNTDEGWNIVRMCCRGADNNFIQTNVIFPYKVGFKKTEWGNYYTVEEAVNMAYEFYTTNPKSSFSKKFRNESSDVLWRKIHEVCDNNKFFTIEEVERTGWTVTKPICSIKGKSYEETQKIVPYECGWMHDGYVRVFIAATQERTYGIVEKDGMVSNNRDRLLTRWDLGVSIFFLLLIIPLSIKQIKANKIQSETLRARLLRLCNPSNFTKRGNYDKDKVDIANVIYKSLLEIDDNDTDMLNKLQQKAIRCLGIDIIDKEKLAQLKALANPKKFMSPYNPEKVALANELFAILNKEGLTYDEVTEVEERLKLLK